MHPYTDLEMKWLEPRTHLRKSNTNRSRTVPAPRPTVNAPISHTVTIDGREFVVPMQI